MTKPKSRGGRPATGQTPMLPVRVPKAIQDAARAKAERRGRTLSAEVNRLLAEYAEQPD